MNPLGKMLVIFGIVLVLTGVFCQFFGKLPGMSRLPGDIYMRKGNFTFYFPIATSLVISLILSTVLNLFWRR
ncbi:MAG: DUF2905 domain-containing protein [Candidatus Omnitrophica bacterium]|nr:DUF2905 domain-containing protein [Candidatus Omnitrophota bacterium]